MKRYTMIEALQFVNDVNAYNTNVYIFGDVHAASIWIEAIAECGEEHMLADEIGGTFAHTIYIRPETDDETASIIRKTAECIAVKYYG